VFGLFAFHVLTWGVVVHLRLVVRQVRYIHLAQIISKVGIRVRLFIIRPLQVCVARRHQVELGTHKVFRFSSACVLVIHHKLLVKITDLALHSILLQDLLFRLHDKISLEKDIFMFFNYLIIINCLRHWSS
jgi:hypothetical protein